MAGRSGHRGERLAPAEGAGQRLHDCAVESWYFGLFSGLSDAVLPSVGACGGAGWFNIAPFALVEAGRLFAECGGTDRVARRSPPFGRSCSARWATSFAPIFTSFSRRLVSDHFSM